MNHSATVTIQNIPDWLSEEMLTKALGAFGRSARVKVSAEKQHAIIRYECAFQSSQKADEVLRRLEGFNLSFGHLVGILNFVRKGKETEVLTEYYFSLLLSEVHEQASVHESGDNVFQGGQVKSGAASANAMEYENELPTTSEKWSPYIVSLVNVFIFVIIGFILSELVENTESYGLKWTLSLTSIATSTYAIGWLISSSSYKHRIRIGVCVAALIFMGAMYWNRHSPSVWLSTIISVTLTYICCRAYIYKCRKFQPAEYPILTPYSAVREWLVGAWVFYGVILLLGNFPPFYFSSSVSSLAPVHAFLDLKYVSTEIALIVLLHGAVTELIKDTAALAEIKQDVLRGAGSDRFIGKALAGFRVLLNVPVWIGRFLKQLALRCWSILWHKWFQKYVLKSMGRVVLSALIFYCLFIASEWLGASIVNSITANKNMSYGNSIISLGWLGLGCAAIASLISWLGYIWLKLWTIEALVEKATFALGGLCFAELLLFGLTKSGILAGSSFSTLGPFFYAVLFVVVLAILVEHFLVPRQEP